MHKRKLIEVALPLEAINRESAREKSIRRGHPSTLHLWWARRPLAAARAVLFAQLVDDPSSHPDVFPSEDEQRAERERLHGIIERLVVWENVGDEKLLTEANAEIMASCDGRPPPILDPFAGGGTIPVEAQRLGLEVHASDLNPVAVLINKAMIELPPKFRDQSPVFPGLADSEIRTWKGAQGLAADVRAYGQLMRDEASKRIGQAYPKVKLADGSEAGVIAWIWARTVNCPNPACGLNLPLVKTWQVGSRSDRPMYIDYSVTKGSGRPRTEYVVRSGRSPVPGGTVGRQGATCIGCSATVPLTHIRQEATADRMGHDLIAIVVDAGRGRTYVSPNQQHIIAADVQRPEVSSTELSTHPQYMGAPRYGMSRVSDLFTPRQLQALVTMCHLVGEIRNRVEQDARRSSNGGSDSAIREYAAAIAVYLALGVSRTADLGNSLVTWSTSRDQARSLFARQAISMAWDFVEVSPFSGASGDIAVATESMAKAIDLLPCATAGVAWQQDAASTSCDGTIVSTDPPYYDNVPYSDLSDFFYPWLRLTLRDVLPDLFGTMRSPKSEELVADYVRHGSRAAAKEFFEGGFKEVFARICRSTSRDFPITVYYAFRQAETDASGTASSGWETLLEGMIQSGWRITATWPLRSERSGRTRDIGSNALASSIVLALRPRDDDGETTDRRGYIATLHAELPGALRSLQQGQIAPVDLPQAAIGPGMAVFSRYAKVVEADGSAMTVRSALARINEILDEVLADQEGDFDAVSRFAIAWYRQHGYGTGRFGAADALARARNTSVELMDRHGILTSRAGKVTLIKPVDLPLDHDPSVDTHTSNWEGLHHLVRLLGSDGIPAAGSFLAQAAGRPDGAIDADLVKELAFLLFSIAEKNGWTKDALSFNALAQSWPDIVAASRESDQALVVQGAFDFDEEGGE